jgi:hypothetical protein
VPSAGAAPAAAPPHPGLVRAAPRATPARRRGLQPGDARGRRSGLDQHRCWGALAPG